MGCSTEGALSGKDMWRLAGNKPPNGYKEWTARQLSWTRGIYTNKQVQP